MNAPSSVLVIDDEAGIRNALTDIVKDQGYTAFQASDGRSGLDLLRSHSIDVVFLDIRLPEMGGIEVLKIIQSEMPHISIIVISGHGNIDLAVQAVKLGAFDFLEKPLGMERIIAITHSAVQMGRLKQENQFLREETILGRSPAIERVRHLIRQSANSEARILITGGNGTGKEMVAREIHRRSSRNAEPFIEVNCAAIPEALIESELFGHEKGSFTGAVGMRRGKFELAEGGTLFLDEVADMSLSAQAKVLRVIQEMRIERVGGEHSVQVDTRVIAATNKDITAEIEAGAFREDLYFRLNVIPIPVPDLRERREDIPLLANYFLRSFLASANGAPKRITEAGMQVLSDYPWPGNVRELKNFIERVTILSDESEIGPNVVRSYLNAMSSAPRVTAEWEGYENMSLSDARRAFERTFIRFALAKNNNNISATSRMLGVYASNLHAKIQKLSIEIEK